MINAPYLTVGDSLAGMGSARDNFGLLSLLGLPSRAFDTMTHGEASITLIEHVD